METIEWSQTMTPIGTPTKGRFLQGRINWFCNSDVTMTSFLSVQNHQYDTQSLDSSDPFGSGSDSVGHNRKYSEMR